MYLILFIIALNIVILFNINKLSEFLNIYDYPDTKLKLHKKKIPLIGGIIIFINLFFLISCQYFFLENFLMLEKMVLKKREIFSLVFFIFSFFLIGLYDDKFTIQPLKKLILMIVIIFFTLSINKILVIDRISLSFYPTKIFFNNTSIFLTIFCIVLLCNSLNFYDGINGQSGILYINIFLYLYLISNFNFFYLILVIVLFFVCFLNLKNKLFFGDNGVYLIASIISISLIYESQFKFNILYVDEIFFLLLFPGFDLVRLTFQRLLSGKNAFYGDREHFHHFLIKKYNLFLSNIILFFLTTLPILLYYLNLNFYFIFIIFIIIYLILFKFIKNH